MKIISKVNNIFSEDHLIVFDKRSLVFIATILLVFVVLVGFKIHGSSITIWNQLLPNDVQDYGEGILFGKPKGVRSDEWIVNTPFAMSQVLSSEKFSLSNESLGGGNTPLLTNLPTKHISTLFRPQFWGYFLLDTERGFAFFWDFKFVVTLIGFFLLFMLLTKNSFWISAFGSIWIYASSFTQWWYSSAAEIMGLSSFLFVALTYLIFSKKKHNIILSVGVIVFLGINFVLFLYPPYQVQLGYLIVFLLIGFTLNNYSTKTITTHWKTKLFSILGGIAIALPVLYKYYLDAKDTIKIIMNTVYPGKRQSLGAGVTLSRYFSGFYSSLLRDGHVPSTFLNASEASNFILLYPLVAIGTVIDFVKKKKIDFVVVMMLLYVVIITFWMKFGFPLYIGKATLWSLAPTERCYMGLGLASIIASIIYLNNPNTIVKTKKQALIAFAIIFGTFTSYGLYLNDHTNHYFKWYFLVIITVIFTIASLLFLLKQRILFAGIILFMTIGPAIFINPISVGLQPILGKESVMIIKDQQQTYVNPKWAVYGNRLLPSFFVATGAEVVDGVKYTPPTEMIKVFDPQNKYEKIWNRYAHTYFNLPKDLDEKVTFDLVYADLYKININPCNPKLKELGVTHLAFDKQPPNSILDCVVSISDKPVNSIWLYKYK